MSIKVCEIVTERIVNALQQGVVPWRRTWDMATPVNLVSGKAYKGVNVFLLGAMRYASPYWCSYKQALAKGGQVRKGEKSTPIIFWKMLDKGENAKGKKEYIPLLRFYNGFNVAQCDWAEGHQPPQVSTARTFEPIEVCERMVLAYKTIPAIDHGGDRACYSPSFDRVSMPHKESFENRESYYSTLFHELVHSTGHKDRLAREGVVNPIRFASHEYSFEELVAEMGAAFLCGRAGILDHTFDNSAAYIGNWIAKLTREPKWIVEASGKASKAYNLILGDMAQEVVEDEEEAA